MRKLGAEARPSQQAKALSTIAQLSWGLNPDILAALAAAGAIPALVRLLGPGSPAEVQSNAARVLVKLAEDADSMVTIAAAGAIPPLVQLLRPGSSAEVQEMAAGALRVLSNSNAENRAAITAASVIMNMEQLMAGLGICLLTPTHRL